MIYTGKISRCDPFFSSGKVQVCGATPAQVFCTLNVGVAFGEISLLAMGEGNKRTANIYSEWNDSILAFLMFLSFMLHTVCDIQYVSYLWIFDQGFIFIKPGFTTMFTLNKTDLFNALGLVSFQVELIFV